MTSSFLRSWNSTLPRSVSSPPNTRWSSCLLPAFFLSLAVMRPPPSLFRSPGNLPKSGLNVYAACTLDEKWMKRLPARHQAWKLGVFPIVGVRVSKMIGGDAACLVHQDGRGGKIPFGFRCERDRGVALAAGDQGKAIGDGVDPSGGHLRPGLLPDLLFEEAAAGNHLGALERVLRAYMDRYVAEERPVPAQGVEELLRRRIVDDTQHRHAVLDQRRRYGPLRDMAQEGARAVDGVDHPHP